MIICKNCQHKNVSGTLFCSECGAQLDGIETLNTQSITQEEIASDLKKTFARHGTAILACKQLDITAPDG